MESIPGVVTISDRIQKLEVEQGEVCVLPAAIKDVISFEASFTIVQGHESKDELLRDLTVAMLDKGTRNRSKIEIAQLIESTGAQLSFNSTGIRASISGKSLVKDLPLVLDLAREQLTEPSFPEDEFALLQNRYLAALQHSLTETASLATTAISQQIFPDAHPNFARSPHSEMELLSSLTTDDVHHCFEENIRVHDLRVAFVGDVDASVVATCMDSFPVSTQSGLEPWGIVDPSGAAPDTLKIPVRDRENLDVRIAHAVPVLRTDADYLPLMVGIYALGGNFSARLMQTIRDEMGLTYGISSRLANADAYYNGTWNTSVTLSRENLERGVNEVLALIGEFVSGGVSEKEVEEARETIAGSWAVSLSTTRSLASSIIKVLERGDELTYLDRFPGLIRAIDAQAVNRVIKQYLNPEWLHVAIAGSLPDAE